MPKFVMLTRLTGEQIHPSHDMIKISKKVEEKIKKTCPTVKWELNLALLGPYDYIDVFEAESIESAFQVAAIVRSYGHAATEVWSAIEWEAFKRTIKS